MLISPSTIKVVAFDLDGTLVDSLAGLHQALNLTLADAGFFSVSAHQVTGWIGNGINVLLERAVQSTASDHILTEVVLRDLRMVFDAHYEKTMISGTQLYNGVEKTLRQLQNRGISLALVTNKSTQFLPGILKDLSLDGMFSLVLGAEDVVVKKPHPSPLYQVLSHFGLYANELVFVGDSKNDIFCAKSAGCISVGVSYGYNYHEPIENSAPDHVIHEFPALLNLNLLMTN